MVISNSLRAVYPLDEQRIAELNIELPLHALSHARRPRRSDVRVEPRVMSPPTLNALWTRSTMLSTSSRTVARSSIVRWRAAFKSGTRAFARRRRCPPAAARGARRSSGLEQLDVQVLDDVDRLHGSGSISTMTFHSPTAGRRDNTKLRAERILFFRRRQRLGLAAERRRGGLQARWRKSAMGIGGSSRSAWST
jgi:hypothetical protein